MISRRLALLSAAPLALAACQPLTPATVAAGQGVIAVAAGLSPIAAAAVATTDLLCQGSGVVYTILDAATNKPVQVPGQTAQFIANLCSLVGAGVNPTALPASAVTVTPIAVAVPKAIG